MKSILVCLDASARAPFVLRTAADLAQRTGAKLQLLRTVGLPPEVDQEMYVHASTTVIERMEGQAKLELRNLAANVPAEMIQGVHVCIGSPWDAICREATALSVDLVIIGSHGYSGLDRILGTTAAKVVNHCDRSVLVVRGDASLT